MIETIEKRRVRGTRIILTELKVEAPSKAPRLDRRIFGKKFGVKIPGVQDVLKKRKRRWYEK